MKLTFDEIADWEEFENLVASYFKHAKNINMNDISNVIVKQSGRGSDGGRDTLVTFYIEAPIITIKNKWVVQCKFHKKPISKKLISDINIPTLIHEYGADGYLLISKSGVTSTLSDSFENLEKNCKLGYNYSIWNGDDFLQKIQDIPILLKYYFPLYHEQKK